MSDRLVSYRIRQSGLAETWPQDDQSLTDRLNLNRDSQGYDIGAPESDEAAA